MGLTIKSEVGCTTSCLCITLPLLGVVCEHRFNDSTQQVLCNTVIHVLKRGIRCAAQYADGHLDVAGAHHDRCAALPTA